MMTAFKNFGSNCFQKHGPVGIDMFKEKKRNTGTACEMCSKLTFTPCLAFLLLTFNM